MKKWEFTFPQVTKEEWFAQIKKDLKEVTLESLQAEWWPEEKITPFHYATEDNIEPVALPDDYFLQLPLIAEWFDVASGDESLINKNILTALSRGAQSIICNVSADSFPDISQLCNGVHLGMIDFGIQTNADAADLFDQAILPNGVHIRIERGKELSADFIKQAESLHNLAKGNLLLIYKLDETQNLIDSAASMFRSILEDYLTWLASGGGKGFFTFCRILIYPDKLYFKQIIQTRVVQQVWLNLEAALEKNKNPLSPVECHISPQSQTDPDGYLIAASSSALAAALTGVKAICIHHIQNPSTPDYYKRIDLNIQHLLAVESGIYHGMDPVSGSYALDHYTRIWSEQIWEKVGGVDVMNFRQKG